MRDLGLLELQSTSLLCKANSQTGGTFILQHPVQNYSHGTKVKLQNLFVTFSVSLLNVVWTDKLLEIIVIYFIFLGCRIYYASSYDKLDNTEKEMWLKFRLHSTELV